MALSSSGRKLLAEVAGCTAAVAVGVASLTHYQQTKQLAAQTFGIAITPASATGTTGSKADDGIVRGGNARTVELTAQRNGHFFAEAEINGRTVTVMVDTGASMVALTYDDARRAGIPLRDSDFTHRANTANGVAKFAPIEIERLAIGNIEVRNVRAAVMEDGKLDTTLLGMTFLSKLGSVAMKSGRLVLEE